MYELSGWATYSLTIITAVPSVVTILQFQEWQGQDAESQQKGASEDITVEKLEGVRPGHYLVPAETVVMKWVDKETAHIMSTAHDKDMRFVKDEDGREKN
jgi:hypothetical protein